MAHVVVAWTARDDLEDLIRSHRLPGSTHDRVRRSIEPLATFPRLGPALDGRWHDFRFIVGPWAWMLIVYAYDADADLVVVVTVQDARSGRAPRSGP